MSKTMTRALCLVATSALVLSADSLFTGTPNAPEGVFETTFTLTAADTVTFQTLGFGGGTNAGGQGIVTGGFDPLIATATMDVDGFGTGRTDDNLIDCHISSPREWPTRFHERGRLHAFIPATVACGRNRGDSCIVLSREAKMEIPALDYSFHQDSPP